MGGATLDLSNESNETPNVKNHVFQKNPQK